MHVLVIELIPYTAQPRQQTDSLKHRLISELLRSITQLH
jgi:hypothetical protein